MCDSLVEEFSSMYLINKNRFFSRFFGSKPSNFLTESQIFFKMDRFLTSTHFSKDYRTETTQVLTEFLV